MRATISLLRLASRPTAAPQAVHRGLKISSAPLNAYSTDSVPNSVQPDSKAKEVRSDTPNNDPQSSASQEEHKSGDEHPAKQPDGQAEPSRSTGFEGNTEVKGGKEGLGARNDKQG